MRAQVLLPKVFNFSFTYNTKKKFKLGDLVEVPLGHVEKLELFGLEKDII